jgi:hypothetical protein
MLAQKRVNSRQNRMPHCLRQKIRTAQKLARDGMSKKQKPPALLGRTAR